jgi:hypothetical protein
MSHRRATYENAVSRNAHILRSSLIDSLLGNPVNKVPAAALCLVIASTVGLLLASYAAVNASVQNRPGDDPSAVADGDGEEDGAIAGPDVGTKDAVLCSFELHPEVLNLKSSGKYVTVVLELPDGRSVRDVFIPSVRLNGVIYASTSFGPHNPVVEFQNKQTLMLKFDKESVQEILAPGTSVPIWVVGSFSDGTCFLATGEVTVVA